MQLKSSLNVLAIIAFSKSTDGVGVPKSNWIFDSRHEIKKKKKFIYVTVIGSNQVMDHVLDEIPYLAIAVPFKTIIECVLQLSTWIT